MFNNIYKGRRVLITGHTGFKGSWLTAWLLSLGAEVAGLALPPPSEPSNFAVLGLEKRISHSVGDVRDLAVVAEAVQAFQPEIIFHLAAQALVRKSYDAPLDTFDTNVRGTMHVLEAARRTPSVKTVVCITSDKCYRNDEWVWGYRETDHLGGEDPYSASKACAEIVAHSYFKSFFADGPAAATVRAGNVIGGGDWAEDRIVPDCARAWAKGEAVTIRSPWATRPWQHVLEPLSGYLWLGARLFAGNSLPGLPLDKEAFNFGPAADVNNTVAEVVDALAGHWPDFKSAMDRAAAAGRKECTLLKLSCDKALAHLNWKAALTFPETIAYTAEWYKAYYGGKSDMFELTMGQIKDYAAAAATRGNAWTA